MYIDYTPEQQRLGNELRTYFAGIVTPEYQAELAETEGGGPLYTQALHRLRADGRLRGRRAPGGRGADGWLGVGWPREYGGQGRTPVEQFVFFDEASRAGAMLPMLSINAVGPAIMGH